MDRSTLLVALAFAALAALVVALGFHGEERYQAARAEQAAAAAAAGEESSALAWLQSETSAKDRLALLSICGFLFFGAYLWILVAAFRESLPWGLVVLFGNGLGAILFVVFVPRQPLLPIFVMTGAWGVAFLSIRF